MCETQFDRMCETQFDQMPILIEKNCYRQSYPYRQGAEKVYMDTILANILCYL